MNLELRQRIERVARRIRSLRLWNALALCWLAWAIVGIVLFVGSTKWGWKVPTGWPLLLAELAAATAVICGYVILRSMRDHRRIARQIEARHPELATLLLAAVEQSPQRGKPLGFLQSAVVRDAVDHGRRFDWTDTVPTLRLRMAQLAHFASLGLLVAACLALSNRAGANVRRDVPGAPAPGAASEEVSSEVKIEPGNTEIERGTSLLVVAEFKGPMPAGATLMVTSGAEDAQVREMNRSLDDPKFVGRVPNVKQDLSYYVEFDGRRSETYRATVFDYPELVRADAELKYPSFTLLEPTIVQDVRHVTAVEGTELTLLCSLNKEVVEATLAGNDGRNIELVREETRDGEGEFVYRAGWTLTETRRFKLRLKDAAGRENKFPPEIVVNMTPNRPAKIVLERPSRDVDVSPIEELQLKANATDDFGVVARGLSYSIGGAEPLDAPLPGDVKPAKRIDIEHLIDFEALKAQPDQLVSYYVWAEDIGSDGERRRAFSDMFFAEVRHFEEIYRQGQQPSESEQQQQEREQQQQQQEGEQAGGPSQQAGELAELQKEIINATWKLIRREIGARPTAEFGEDSRSLQEAQQAAIEQLNTLAEQLQDPQSLEHVEVARTSMTKALEQLTAAADGGLPKPLRTAISPEQEAYQALLKLRAREFEVVRGQEGQRGQRGQRAGRGGRGGQRGQRGQQAQRGQRGGQRNGLTRQQRQLGQLELSPDENRYETQTRAGAPPEETPAQAEQRDFLNRLQQLAQRQGDVNERMRELQSELENANDQERREELERELARLRDQQREVLRDTDELLGRMEQSENQQQMQDAQQQMEESRTRMQEASEALEQGRLPQALTEATRASRELNDVRDQFRRQAANRFSEEMNEMRQTARDLDQRQQQLSEQLNREDGERGKSLRDSGERAETREGVVQQREQLTNLLDRMQRTVEEAEQPEPQLARQLYDTIREAGQQRIDEALDVTQRLLEVGIEREASDAMRAANQGIQQLREGVERAAESVLGDESEALRQAQRDVDRLAEELNREIQQALRAQGAGQEGQNQRGQGQRGQGQRGEGQRGEGQRGEGQRGEGQRGEGQRGEGQRGEGQRGEGQGQEGEQPGQGEGQRGEGQRGQSQRGQGQPGEAQQGESQRGQGQRGQGQRGEGQGEQGEGQPGEGPRGRGQRGQGQRGQGERGEGQQQGQGEQQGQGRGQRGQGGGENGGQPGEEPQNADQPGQANGERQGRRGQGGRGGNQDQPQADGQRRGGNRRGGANQGGGGGGFEGGDLSQLFDEGTWQGPITGDDFRNWSDRLRNVEDALGDEELRSDAARIRDRATDIRREFRNGATPDWTKLQDMVAVPLNELSRRLAEEIQRRESPDSLVPIDRDPVPPDFAEPVRRYYQRIGSGE